MSLYCSSMYDFKKVVVAHVTLHRKYTKLVDRKPLGNIQEVLEGFQGPRRFLRFVLFQVDKFQKPLGTLEPFKNILEVSQRFFIYFCILSVLPRQSPTKVVDLRT